MGRTVRIAPLQVLRERASRDVPTPTGEFLYSSDQSAPFNVSGMKQYCGKEMVIEDSGYSGAWYFDEWMFENEVELRQRILSHYKFD